MTATATAPGSEVSTLEQIDSLIATLQKERERADGNLEHYARRLDEGLARLLKMTDEIRSTIEHNAVVIMGDKPMPQSWYQGWASPSKIREWKDAGKLAVEYINNRLHIKPSDFFACLQSESKAAPTTTPPPPRRKGQR